MIKENKWSILILMSVLILVSGYYYFFIMKKARNNSPITKQEEMSNADLVIKNLADKYQTTTDWEKDFKYTQQIQEQLITGKPTLFTGQVNDLFSRDGKKFLRFSDSYSHQNRYELELECDQQIVDMFLRLTTSDYLNNFALVANVNEVSKPVPIEMMGYVDFEESGFEVDIKSPETFILKGTCIDIAYLKDN